MSEKAQSVPFTSLRAVRLREELLSVYLLLWQFSPARLLSLTADDILFLSFFVNKSHENTKTYNNVTFQKKYSLCDQFYNVLFAAIN